MFALFYLKIVFPIVYFSTFTNFRFLDEAVFTFSFLFNFVVYFMPGKQPLAYYACIDEFKVIFPNPTLSVLI